MLNYTKARLGYVYILTNPSMPGLLKIGMTTSSPKERARDISKDTGVPTPFVVAASYLTEQPYKVEQRVHKALGKHRVNGNREFFKVDLHEAERTILDQRIVPVERVAVPKPKPRPAPAPKQAIKRPQKPVERPKHYYPPKPTPKPFKHGQVPITYREKVLKPVPHQETAKNNSWINRLTGFAAVWLGFGALMGVFWLLGVVLQYFDI